MDFRRRPFNQKSLVFRKIQGPIWRSKDHLVMKALSKNVKNHEILLFHYSVRQKIGDPGSISTQNMFPLLPVTPKRPELQYETKYFVFAENPVFQFFTLLIPYCPGGTKRRNSNSNSLFWGSKTGIRIDTKWHHMAPN